MGILEQQQDLDLNSGNTESRFVFFNKRLHTRHTPPLAMAAHGRPRGHEDTTCTGHPWLGLLGVVQDRRWVLSPAISRTSHNMRPYCFATGVRAASLYSAWCGRTVCKHPFTHASWAPPAVVKGTEKRARRPVIPSLYPFRTRCAIAGHDSRLCDAPGWVRFYQDYHLYSECACI